VIDVLATGPRTPQVDKIRRETDSLSTLGYNRCGAIGNETLLNEQGTTTGFADLSAVSWPYVLGFETN